MTADLDSTTAPDSQKCFQHLRNTDDIVSRHLKHHLICSEGKNKSACKKMEVLSEEYQERDVETKEEM